MLSRKAWTVVPAATGAAGMVTGPTAGVDEVNVVVLATEAFSQRNQGVSVEEAVAAWLADRFSRFPVRQHLFVNRRVRLGTWERDTGDTAEVRTDYVSPACRGGGDGAAVLDLLSGGRCVFTAVRTPDGWRLSRVVVRETWRRPTGGRPDGVID